MESTVQGLNQTSSRRSRWRRPAGAVFIFVLFAGMLFWTKLRLVSDIPRSAYAVPKEEQPDRLPLPVDGESDLEADSPDDPSAD